jgi:hypothetical protein
VAEIGILVSRREWRLGNNVARFATFVCRKFFILSVFSSSHPPILASSVLFSSCDNLIFLALSETKYLLATPTVTRISELTEEFSVCTSGTIEENWWVSANPDTKKYVGIKIVLPRQGHFGQMC